MQADEDVLILGAGAAGLSAAVELATCGLKVAILEARDRIGGRMHTHIDPGSNVAVEFGAEFIHGLAPEIWEIAQREKISIVEVEGENWCERNGRISPCESIPDVDSIFSKLDSAGPDESFLQFLNRRFPHLSPESKQRALNYVSGFHAADPALISVHSLAFGTRADERIEGDRSFRMTGGYHTLLDVFHRQLVEAGVPIHLETIAVSVEWREGEATVIARDRTGSKTLVAPRVLVTLPLGVLQAEHGQEGALSFVPDLPVEKKQALEHLAMGKVARVTMRFDERFWDGVQPAGDSKSLADASFLFAQEDWFPTWWTTMPLKAPIITGWSPASWATHLAGQPKEFVVDKALTVLSRITRTGRQELDKRFRGSYWHDWESDPFSRGAYSYVKVGGEFAQGDLGRPLGNAVFFAGEATDVTGHIGTVHGAIASGKRAAQEILRSR
jgi:monoamine oxidase